MYQLMLPVAVPRRSCGAIGVLEAVTFALAVAAVIVFAQLGAGIWAAVGFVVVLLALVRGVPVPRLPRRVLPGGAA